MLVEPVLLQMLRQLARVAGVCRAAQHDGPFSWHVKGNLFLTGNQWSSTRLGDDRGHPCGYASRFDFNEGQVFNGYEMTFHTNNRTLCASGPDGEIPRSPKSVLTN